MIGRRDIMMGRCRVYRCCVHCVCVGFCILLSFMMPNNHAERHV